MKRAIVFLNRAVTAGALLALLPVSVLAVFGIFGIVPYIVCSGSMEPGIHTGAVVFINTRDLSAKAGDIITYRLSGEGEGGRVVTHRVVDAKDGFYITKGDANAVEDLAVVSPEQVVGSYMWQIPYLGYLAARFNQKLVISIILYMLSANLLFSLLLAFNQKKQKCKRQQALLDAGSQTHPKEKK